MNHSYGGVAVGGGGGGETGKGEEVYGLKTG